MKSLSEALIKSIAGSQVYQRGLAYYNEGRVHQLNINNTRIVAEVSGSQTYRVTLHHTLKQFDGSCSCPASDNFDFCKHCVAVALDYYYRTQTNQEISDKSGSDQVLGYVNTLTKPQLVDELHKILLNNESMMEQWQLRAEIASGGLVASDVRKRITKAIPYKPSGLWRYRDVAAYFDLCESNFSILQEPLMALEPAAAHKLLIYAAQRLEKTLETIDDSGGYRFTLESLLKTWSTQLLAATEWDLKARVRCIVDLIIDQKYSFDVFDLPESAADSIQDEGMELVHSALKKHWLTLNPDSTPYSDDYFQYSRIERLLVKHAQHKNDVDAEFGILERAANSIRRCIELVMLSIEHGRFEDAELWLKHAEQLGNLGPRDHRQLENTRIALWKAEGHFQQALEAEWARFAETHLAEHLKALHQTAKQLGTESEWLKKGVGLAEDAFAAGTKTRQRVNNMIDIYLNHGLVESAIELSKDYSLDQYSLLRIVDASENINDYTFSLLERAVNEILTQASNRSYSEAVNVLLERQPRLGDANSERFFDAVSNIYNQPNNKRKPNFVKKLKAAFPGVFNT